MRNSEYIFDKYYEKICSSESESCNIVLDKELQNDDNLSNVQIEKFVSGMWMWFDAIFFDFWWERNEITVFILFLAAGVCQCNEVTEFNELKGKFGVHKKIPPAPNFHELRRCPFELSTNAIKKSAFLGVFS